MTNEKDAGVGAVHRITNKPGNTDTFAKRLTVCRKLGTSELQELQQDLDTWLTTYNEQRTHQGKIRCGHPT